MKINGKIILKSQKIKILPEFKNIHWYGVISQLKPYALIWAINSNLQIDFKPSEYSVKKITFPKYCYKNKLHLVYFTVYINRLESIHIFKDIKNAEYLLKIEGDLPKEELLDFFKKLKDIKEIRGIIPLAIERLRKDKKILNQI